MTLGSRIEVLALMVRGAYRLSGMVDDRKTATSSSLLALPQGGAINEQRQIIQTDSNTSIVSANSSDATKTIIKRPLRLASLKQRTKYFRNHFPLCAENFFSVVFKSLNDSLRDIFATKREVNEDHTDNDPGIQILFPAQALLTLGAFTRCAINTPLQKKFASILLPFAFQLREVPSLHIRRASVVALYDAMESLFRSRAISAPPPHGNST
jgi:hypothetical protein